FFQFAAAQEQKRLVVVLIGAEFLANSPPLLNPGGDGFNQAFFDSPSEAERLRARPVSASGEGRDIRRGEQAIRSGEASAIVIIPRDLPEQLLNENEIDIPIKYNSVDDTSQNTYLRVREVLSRWRKSIVAGRLKRDRKTESYTDPIQVTASDVATAREVGGNI